jgi:hypothetical protein
MSLRSTLLKVFAAVALAFATFTPAVAAPPAGMMQINYHRTDGIYTNWGVHLWKSPNMPLEGIEWPNPMVPTGKNDFGVYWQKPLDEFKTGHGTKCKVNYIIHQGDMKEQGGKDMDFNGLEHSEIWVYQGDRSIFFSLDEVKAAHADIK